MYGNLQLPNHITRDEVALPVPGHPTEKRQQVPQSTPKVALAANYVNAVNLRQCAKFPESWPSSN